jgi:predicted PurR-regulated permease PerM
LPDGISHVSAAPERTRFELDIPVRTIVRVLVAALCVWALLKLWPHLLLILVSLLIAVTLDPAIAWMEARRVSRPVAVLVIGFTFFALLIGGAMLVLPRLSQEMSYLVENLPRFEDAMKRHVPPGEPTLQKVVEQVFLLPSSPEVLSFLAKPLVWGRAAVELVTGGLLIVVLSLYFLVDGKRLYAWLLAYVPRRQRQKVAETATEVEDVIYAYMLGQLVTSLICTGATFAILTAFGVPAALPLALLAGICDVVPVVGLIISTVPAVLLAMTVSPATAFLVLLALLGYHAIETYVLVPRIYGRHLRLSTLAVLIAILVGVSLQGVIGAILILPVVAAYPVIERIWLRDYLGPETVTDHRALARAAEHGGEEAAVEAVLRGDRTGPIATHADEAAPAPLRPVKAR